MNKNHIKELIPLFKWELAFLLRFIVEKERLNFNVVSLYDFKQIKRLIAKHNVEIKVIKYYLQLNNLLNR
ncbi:hypothetical protein F5ESL0233_06370 [Lactobacillus sp. ESL0233]|nr:hypothetical protein F5ESL0233_06370 [Lactobacillus sp. ESL0233]